MRFLVILLLLVLSACGASPPHRAVSSTLVSSLGNSTVALLRPSRSTIGEYVPFCSGVFISNKTILTAYHCVSDTTGTITIGTLEDAEVTEGLFYGQHHREYAVLRSEVDQDLALLTYADNRPMPEHSAVSLSDTLPVVGESIVVCGHPGGLLWSFSHGMVSQVEFRVGWAGSLDILLFQHQAPTWGGNSGGPIVNLDGALIGIVHGGVHSAESIGVGIHLDSIKNFISHR